MDVIGNFMVRQQNCPIARVMKSGDGHFEIIPLLPAWIKQVRSSKSIFVPVG